MASSARTPVRCAIWVTSEKFLPDFDHAGRGIVKAGIRPVPRPLSRCRARRINEAC